MAQSASSYGAVGAASSSTDAAYHVVNVQSKPMPQDFYYVLVFPNAHESLSRSSDTRLTWKEAMAKLSACVAGGERRQQQAIAELQTAWINKFRSALPEDVDTIPLGYFNELVRELVISKLDGIPGLLLQSYTSQDQKSLFITIFLSKEVLLQQAETSRTNLRVWDELDPGIEYWKSPKHLRQDKQYYTKDQAQTTLYRLFLAGEISAFEAQLYEGESSTMWSNRLNLLDRLLDSNVECTNDFNLHFPYSNQDFHQYLFPPVVDESTLSTPLQRVDKIRLTRQFLERYFDYDMLQQQHILQAHLCVPKMSTSAVAGDAQYQLLAYNWASWYAPVYNVFHSQQARWYNCLVYLPLDQIRNYYGEQVALYFEFLRFLFTRLSILLLLSALQQLISPKRMPQHVQHCLLFVCYLLYSLYFLFTWKEKQLSFSIKYGTFDWTPYERLRPQFHGHFRISPITNAPELTFSTTQRKLRQAVNFIILSFFIVVFLVLTYGTFYLQSYLEKQNLPHGRYLSPFLNAICIIFTTPFYKQLCIYLNDWENYRTHTAYDTNLTVKYAVFQTLNYYACLLFIAFVKSWTFGCRNVSHGTKLAENEPASCMMELKTQLNMIFAVLFGYYLCVYVVDWMSHAYKQYQVQRRYTQTDDVSTSAAIPLADTASASTYSSTSTSAVAFKASLSYQLEQQMALKEFSDFILESYSNSILFYGYVLWFGIFIPHAVLLLMIFIIFMLRLDASSIHSFYRRPYPAQAASIGGWEYYLNMLSIAGIIVQAGILLITSAALSASSAVQKSDGAEVVEGLKLADVASIKEPFFISISAFFFHHDHTWYHFCFDFLLSVQGILLLYVCGYQWLETDLHAQHEEMTQRLAYLQDKYLHGLHGIQKYPTEDVDPDMLDSMEAMEDIDAAERGNSPRNGLRQRAGASRLEPGNVFLNGIYRHLISGSGKDEDAVEEIRESMQELMMLRAGLLMQPQPPQQQQRPGVGAAGWLGKVQLQLGKITTVPICDPLSKSMDAFIKFHFRHSPSTHAKASNADANVNANANANASASARSKRSKLSQMMKASTSSAKPSDILPESARQSQVVKKSLHPEWNESFSIPFNSLYFHIDFELLDWDALGKNSVVGSAAYDMSQLYQHFLADLHRQDSLKYTMQRQRPLEFNDCLQVEIPVEIKAKYLKSMKKQLDATGPSLLSLQLQVEFTPLGETAMKLYAINKELEAHQQQLESYQEWPSE